MGGFLARTFLSLRETTLNDSVSFKEIKSVVSEAAHRRPDKSSDKSPDKSPDKSELGQLDVSERNETVVGQLGHRQHGPIAKCNLVNRAHYLDGARAAAEWRDGARSFSGNGEYSALPDLRAFFIVQWPCIAAVA